MPSVFPDWMASLPMQQQSVLVLAARGPDGIREDHPCKDIVRAYRASVLRAAYYGRALVLGEKADSFMSFEKLPSRDLWKEVMAKFFSVVDELPHHYLLHLAHGAEILGYKHPHPVIQASWREFYYAVCEDMHLTPETAEEMAARLNDWGREHWSIADRGK